MMKRMDGVLERRMMVYEGNAVSGSFLRSRCFG